jgi:predicted DNA-binding transcriptional regulator AlpA
MSLPDAPVVRVAGACARYGISKATLYNWLRTGNFPQGMKLGPNTLAWRLEDLLRWEESRVSAA